MTLGLYYSYQETARTLADTVLYATGRLQPVFGRWFADDEVAPGGPPVVVLSHGLWTRRYGSDPALIRPVAALRAE